MLVDQLSSSVQIDFAAISLAGNYTLTFQSQLIVDPYDFIDASFYTSTELLMFDLDNQNWELVSSLTGWYAVYGLSKNYTVSFSDLENDEVKIFIIKDGGLDIQWSQKNSDCHRKNLDFYRKFFIKMMLYYIG